MRTALDSGMAPVPKLKRLRTRHFLAEWRNYCGLTQERAAERIGVTQSTLSRIERGVVPYDQDFLELAAEAYGTTTASLIVRNPLDDSAVWSIQERLAKASPEQRRQALVIVDAFLKAGNQ